MAYLLNVVYVVLAVLAAPWLLVGALQKGKYRDGWSQKLFGLVPRRQSEVPCVWIHAVSLGEVSLIASLISEVQRRYPHWEVVISTTTLTGYTLAKTRYTETQVFYCPLDFTWAVHNAMERIRPTILMLAELELWPNLIREARRAGTKVAIINGRLSDRSFRGYRRFGRWMRGVLGQVDLIAAQNGQYAERFLALGARPEAVHITGSLKFDGAQTDRANAATVRLRQLAGFQDSDIVFLAGSTQEPEERLAIEAFRRLAAEHPELRLILVPRHPDRFAEVSSLLSSSGLAWQKRSRLDVTGPDPRARVLLVDRVGELGAWWGTATIAYVGGSMGSRQGQNMIEPAAYGCAVAFGPKTRNFRDVVAALLDARAAVVVQDGDELQAFVRRALEQPDFAAELGQHARQVVAAQLGATRRTVDLLEALTAEPSTVIRRDRNAA
jgi:3-deoxy-D-manno-octulosonic-acid transferase